MNSPANSPPQNKRGRGRPAKVNKGVVAASQPKAVKKPKSPVKLPPTSPAAVSGSASPQSPVAKKGRGRPKASGTAAVSPKAKSGAAGRGRGRPPKGGVAKKSPVKKAATGGTGKRGRPPTKKAVEQQQSASEESSAEHSDAVNGV